MSFSFGYLSVHMPIHRHNRPLRIIFIINITAVDLQIQIVLKLLIDILVFRNILNISNHNNAWSFFKMALSKIKENKQKTLKLFFLQRKYTGRHAYSYIFWSRIWQEAHMHGFKGLSSWWFVSTPMWSGPPHLFFFLFSLFNLSNYSSLIIYLSPLPCGPFISDNRNISILSFFFPWVMSESDKHQCWVFKVSFY